MFDVDKWRNWPLFSNSLTAWLIAGSIAVGVLTLLLLVRPLVRRYATRLRGTERTEFLEVPMEVLSRTTTLFFIVISIYAGAQALEVGERLTRMLNSVATIALFWQLGLWFATAVGEFLERRRRHNLAENREALGSLAIIKFLVSVVIWVLV